MSRCMRFFSSVAFGVLAVSLLYDVALAGPKAESAPVLLDVGDRVQLVEGNVGCRVARPSALERRAGLDCRRAGALRGTYGIFMGDRKVVVVRFVSARTAKVVFTANHAGAARRCS